MRIEFTLHDEPGSDAGGMGVTSGLTRVYRERGHEVGLLCFADLPAGLPFLAKTIAFPGLVAARLRDAEVDVVDAATGDGWILGLLRRRQPRPRPLLVCRSHGMSYLADRANREEARRGNLELSWKYPLYWGGLRPRQDTAAMRSADLCLYLNEREREIAIAELGIAPGRARVVDNGLPAELLGRPLAPLPPLAEGPRIAHIGSYLPHKGTSHLVAALERVFAAHPRAAATLLGTGADRDAVLSDFQPAARDRVEVIPRYERAALPELLSGHAITVSASIREGFPLGTLEAMACGLVPVVTDIPGPTQYVRDGANGLLVPVADPAAMAAAIEHLIADPERFERLRGAAHATAQEYSWERVGRQTLALYEEAMGR
jgi:glycosyltransferase involved in cell wall biosynthesis